jgi:hypothetical protein
MSPSPFTRRYWVGLGFWRLTLERGQRPVFERTELLLVGFGVEEFA